MQTTKKQKQQKQLCNNNNNNKMVLPDSIIIFISSFLSLNDKATSFILSKKMNKYVVINSISKITKIKWQFLSTGTSVLNSNIIQPYCQTPYLKIKTNMLNYLWNIEELQFDLSILYMEDNLFYVKNDFYLDFPNLLNFLTTMPSLKRLLLESDGSIIDKFDIKNISKINTLEHLEFKNMTIVESAFTEGIFDMCESLSLTYCSFVNDEFTPSCLQGNTTLKHLNVKGCGITDDEILYVVEMLKSLETLDITENEISEKCLKIISEKYKNIKIIF